MTRAYRWRRTLTRLLSSLMMKLLQPKTWSKCRNKSPAATAQPDDASSPQVEVQVHTSRYMLQKVWLIPPALPRSMKMIWYLEKNYCLDSDLSLSLSSMQMKMVDNTLQAENRLFGSVTTLQPYLELSIFIKSRGDWEEISTVGKQARLSLHDTSQIYE